MPCRLNRLVTVAWMIIWCVGVMRAQQPQQEAGQVAPIPAAGHSAAPASQGALSNKDVIKLSQIGLEPDVIITKVNTAPQVAFNLETDDLIALKTAGVAPKIIAAMIQRSSSPPTAPSGAEVFSNGGKVWVLDTGRLDELQWVSGYVEESIGQAFKQSFLLTIKDKFALLTRGLKADVRLTKTPEVLYTRYNPTEIGIVRFTIQPDKNRRYIWVISRIGSNEGEFYPVEDDIKFDKQRRADGIYRLTLKTKLAPGEYGLVVPGGDSGYLVYDFAVDGQ